MYIRRYLDIEFGEELEDIGDFLLLEFFLLDFLKDFMHLGAGILELPGQDLLVEDSLIGIGFYHHIVDILDKDNIGIQLVEVLEQGTMSGRAEEELVVLIAEVLIIKSKGYRIRALALVGEAHLEVYSILFFQAGAYLGQLVEKEGAIFLVDGKMQIDHLALSGIEERLAEVFFEGGHYLFSIFVEGE